MKVVGQAIVLGAISFMLVVVGMYAMLLIFALVGGILGLLIP